MRCAVFLVLVVAMGCSQPGGTADAATPAADAGGNHVVDAGVPDAGETLCDGGRCMAPTSLSATFSGVSRTLAFSHLGLEERDGGTYLYVETYAGGDPACPEPSSPTPDRMLIMSGIPLRAAGSTVTEQDGVEAVFFDFVGDQLPSIVPARASRIELTIHGVSTTPEAGAFLHADVEASFDGGAASGTFDAPHCDSLDG